MNVELSRSELDALIAVAESRHAECQYAAGYDQQLGQAIEADDLSSAVTKLRNASMGSHSAIRVQCGMIYKEYPRKIGKQAALIAIEKALRKVGFERLIDATRAFAASPAGKRGKFTPHPATWFNQGRYDDDPREWEDHSDVEGKDGGMVYVDLPEGME